jgi:type I restriction enzyme S subunit
VWGEDPDGDGDSIVLRSTEQTVDGYWQIDDPAVRKLSEKDRLSARLDAGDLLLTKSSGSALHIGKTTLVDEPVAKLGACYSNFMQRIRLRTGFSPRVAWYVLNNGLARVQLNLLSNSTTGLANLNGAIIGELVLVVATQIEQFAIAAFQERETAKIDALIAEQEKLLALLAEKRQATISHAVTKGLNPDSPMKDSGIPWLGPVPGHWVVAPFRYCVDFQEGPGILAVDFHEEGVPLLRVAGVQTHWASLEGCNHLDPEKVRARWDHFRVQRGDLLISASASMGTVCEVGAEVAGSIPYTGIIRLRGIDGVMIKNFIRYVVVSASFLTQIELLKAGATIQHFGPSHLNQMVVAQPPEDEQVQISSYLDSALAKFRELEEEAQNAIGLLKERRSALIAAAVTGQIDVRNTTQEIA